MILLHVCPQDLNVMVMGHYYTIPPNEPVEIQNEEHARSILSRKAFFGLVEVRSKSTRQGVIYDLDGAIEEATERLQRADFASVTEWARTQVSERVQKGLPPLPPGEWIAGAIDRQGYDLSSFGITVPTAVIDNEKAALRAENQALKETLAGIESRLAAMEQKAPKPAKAAKTKE